MRRTLRKTLNRVDREKCDIAYVGAKLREELELLAAEGEIRFRMTCSSEWCGDEKVINLLTPFNAKIVEWVIPGGWILRYHEALQPEATRTYYLFDKHYNRGDR